MKVLVVCNCNINRSPTVEKWIKETTNHEVRSAGIYHGYPYQVNEELLDWSDLILVMDLSQSKFIKERFNVSLEKIKMIGISDQYEPDSPELIDLLEFWFSYNQHLL